MDLAIMPSDLGLPSASQMCHAQAQGGGRESSLQEFHEVRSVTSLTGVWKYEQPQPLCCWALNTVKLSWSEAKL